MPAKRLTMRKIRDILRLSFVSEMSLRQINASTKVSTGGVQKMLAKAAELKLTWQAVEEMDDGQLARLFYPKADTKKSKRFEVPDWTEVYQELKKKGVTKQLLWEEYTKQYPNRCYSYSQFCDRYLTWQKKQKRSMRQVHKAGEKLFVDYAGHTVPIVCASTGEIRTAQIFVAVFGASNYTFAEATYSQALPDWLGSHVRAFEFFGGLPEMVIPDNLRSAVSKACRYDPELNRSYQQLAEHYSIAVMPARPYKPKDKSKAEVGVQIIERWILAKLRHQTFFSLAELNLCIKALLTDVNNRPFKQLKGTRQEWFDSLDKPLLAPLPKHPYQYTEIKSPRVNIDYHVEFDEHFYSVPHHLVGEKVELHATDSLIKIYFLNQSIFSHPRVHRPGMTTEPSHMPVKHEKHHKWSPGRLKNWAKDVGPEVLKWVTSQLDSRAHPEQAYRVCLGLLNLTRSYPFDRLNNACAIANTKSLTRLKNIKSILESNQDKLAPESEQGNLFELPQTHKNIRGPQSFN
jgi:transposase